jgi:hypothetical protein
MTLTTSAIERTYVVRALQRVEQGERDSLEELRSALCAFVSALRLEGADKDTATRVVTELIMTPASPAGESNLRAPAREALIELATHWCAEQFSSD